VHRKKPHHLALKVPKVRTVSVAIRPISGIFAVDAIVARPKAVASKASIEVEVLSTPPFFYNHDCSNVK
jgi:hypothetical protein